MSSNKIAGPMTMMDAELSRGSAGLMAAYGELDAARAALAPQGTMALAQDRPGIELGTLRDQNPEYLGEFWEDCEALYRGGHHLLRNKALMDRLFPSHNAELGAIYAERCRRAFYIPYAGKIVDILTAGLEGDPIRIVAEDEDEDTAAAGAGEVPEWWTEWTERVTAEGAGLDHTYDFHGFVCEAIRRAQVKQGVWILCDLPRVDEALAAAADTALAQEELGLRDPYVCLVDASEVVDWESDRDGTLMWVLRHQVSRRRDNPMVPRGAVTHTWTFWWDDHWERYELVMEPGKSYSDKHVVPMVDQGAHPFGRVPWIRFRLPDGLWTMGKLESLAREHFNKRAAVGWAELKSLFAVLYEFLASPAAAPVTVGAPAGAADPNRATNQIRGQGWTQRRGEKDRAEFIGPDVAPFQAARESCAEMMQEMHRVTSTMAASADMGSAALQRSAESKRDDRTDEQKVMEAFGLRGRALAWAIIELVAAGRGEDPPDECHIQGMESFDTEAMAIKIANVVELFAGVPILSPTVKRHVLGKLYQALMSDDASPETLETMRRELREAVESEGVLLGMGPGGTGSLAAPMPPGAEDDPEDEATDPPDPSSRPPRRAAPPAPAGPRTMMSSRRPPGR